MKSRHVWIRSAAPLLLGDGISLFAGLGSEVKLERIDTAAFADAIHLRFRVVK
ncbi:MAG: hypothetical protein ACOH19_03240 [Rhodoglobus sp.]